MTQEKDNPPNKDRGVENQPVKHSVVVPKPETVDVGGDDPRTNQTQATKEGLRTGEDPSVKAPKLEALRGEQQKTVVHPKTVIPTKAPERVKKEEKKN